MNIFSGFWKWYERHYTLNLAIAAGLFVLQLTHLFWLAADVIAPRLVNQSFFPVSQFWQNIIVLVDYTEIPALISTGLIYVNELRKGYNFKSALFIVLLLSQLLHMFWITDEFVVEQFTGAVSPVAIPAWLAWVAIMIDYLELPVIYDTVRRLFISLGKGNLKEAAEAVKNR
jgi:hypothetical protein